jgi:hypothetical protein
MTRKPTYRVVNTDMEPADRDYVCARCTGLGDAKKYAAQLTKRTGLTHRAEIDPITL